MIQNRFVCFVLYAQGLPLQRVKNHARICKGQNEHPWELGVITEVTVVPVTFSFLFKPDTYLVFSPYNEAKASKVIHKPTVCRALTRVKHFNTKKTETKHYYSIISIAETNKRTRSWIIAHKCNCSTLNFQHIWPNLLEQVLFKVHEHVYTIPLLPVRWCTSV